MRAGTALLILAILLVGGSAGLLASCNDTAEQEMYQRMAAGGNGGATPPRTPGADGMAPPGLGQEAVEAEDEVDLEPVLAVTTADKTDKGEPQLRVKAPYPEFDGEGRYDIKVLIMIDEYTEPQVYRIVALDAEGGVVGEQQRHLQLPMKKPRSFDLNNFYCKRMPAAIEFYLTDKEAIAAGEGEGEGEAGARGGSGAPPSAAGGGRGLAGAGGGGGDQGEEDY